MRWIYLTNLRFSGSQQSLVNFISFSQVQKIILLCYEGRTVQQRYIRKYAIYDTKTLWVACRNTCVQLIVATSQKRLPATSDGIKRWSLTFLCVNLKIEEHLPLFAMPECKQVESTEPSVSNNPWNQPFDQKEHTVENLFLININSRKAGAGRAATPILVHEPQCEPLMPLVGLELKRHSFCTTLCRRGRYELFVFFQRHHVSLQKLPQKVLRSTSASQWAESQRRYAIRCKTRCAQSTQTQEGVDNVCRQLLSYSKRRKFFESIYDCLLGHFFQASLGGFARSL